ncbi:MAG: C40 family peptidase, partial [Candidatus Omnitrophica bacterium]|nr:C40 family peptidase [Candidatus Omnitrophota bacterium]
SVVDLRAKPQTTPRRDVHDPLEETQLLYGERVRLLTVKDGWAYVEAVEQPEFTHGRRWQGYPGWLPVSSLLPWEPLQAPTIVVTDTWAPAFEDAFGVTPSPWRFPLGTYLRATDMDGALWKVDLVDRTVVWLPRRSASPLMELLALPPAERRHAVVHAATRFLGNPYYWGGRSPPPVLSAGGGGVDCSGLVNLAHRAVGFEIPRDAHEQFLRARPVSALQPGDLIFLSERSNPQRIVHVMLYAGNDEIIEGPGTGQAVRRLAISARLGHPLDRLVPGLVVDGQTVFFGTYLP